MYAVTMIFCFILALGMFAVFIARKIVESPAPPKNLTLDMIHDLEVVVNAYYGGTVSTRLYIALIIGGSTMAEIVHGIINFGRT